VFYLVWSPQADTPPKVKFKSLEQARKVAGKLKGRFPENDFYVLQEIPDASESSPSLATSTDTDNASSGTDSE
jgi:hypothetical protein